MAPELRPLINDHADESTALFEVLSPLTEQECALPTPAVGWSITDQVSHLAYFDETTLLSLTDADRFRREAAELVAGGDDFPDQVAARHRHLTGSMLSAWFRRARVELLAGYAEVDPQRRLPWYGPDMGVASSVTARLMETWAHGQDIVDALGIARPG
ncbi:MAG: maleylpyruvate isomerase family mycothiol-dependent enzyme, partial [Actinobacteria bacterium]|nr:maleylpyruvate isomerase family mycothiol-dependent enzyme [Actinomycetota bacterium]